MMMMGAFSSSSFPGCDDSAPCADAGEVRGSRSNVARQKGAQCTSSQSRRAWFMGPLSPTPSHCRYRLFYCCRMKGRSPRRQGLAIAAFEELLHAARGLADALLIFDQGNAYIALALIAEADTGAYGDMRFVQQPLGKFERTERAILFGDA